MFRKRETHWQFTCPECGFGDAEIGGLAADEEIHCDVCLEETGRHVVLHRWLAVSDAPARAVTRVRSIAA